MVKRFYVAALAQTENSIDDLRDQAHLVRQSAHIQTSWLATKASVGCTKSPLIPIEYETRCPAPALTMQHPQNESHPPSPKSSSRGVDKSCHELPSGLLDFVGTGRDVYAPTPSACLYPYYNSLRRTSTASTTSIDDRYLGDDDGQEFSQSCHGRSEKSYLSSVSSEKAPPVRVCVHGTLTKLSILDAVISNPTVIDIVRWPDKPLL